MKKQHTWVLLLMAGLALGSCSSDDSTVVEKPETQPTNGLKTYHATTVATMGENGTRTLALDGNTLNVGWATTEKVYVVDGLTAIGNMSPTAISGTSATLEGEITTDEELSKGESCTLRFPRAERSYTAQKGTLADIAENFDYAECDVEIQSVDGNDVTFESGTMENLQAIVQFTFNQNFTCLSIASDILSYAVTVIPESATNSVYVALPIGTSEATTLYFTARNISGNTTTYYQGTKDISTSLQNGRFYTASVSLSEVTAPQLGDLYYSDGTWSTTLTSGKTPVGVIVYLANGNNDPYTETANGVVMSLTMPPVGALYWDKYPSTGRVYSAYDFVDESTDLNRSEGVSGYTITRTLGKYSPDRFIAFGKYLDYHNTVPVPASTTRWFMPSAQQYMQAVKGLGGYSGSYNTFYQVNETSVMPNEGGTVVANWHNAMTKAGSYYNNIFALGEEYNFWCSSEYDEGKALYITMENGSCFAFQAKAKDLGGDNVWPFLAF